MIRQASEHAPAAAFELCKKLDKIAADHEAFNFEHGFEKTKEKKRYWLLELEDTPLRATSILQRYS